MTRIKIEVEFEIDDSWCANSEHQEEREWFWNDVIPSCMVVLHSNEVGDTISQTDSFTIKKISTTAREYASPVIEELINESELNTMEKLNENTLSFNCIFCNEKGTNEIPLVQCLAPGTYFQHWDLAKNKGCDSNINNISPDGVALVF